jgi:flagellar motor switch protein FliM
MKPLSIESIRNSSEKTPDDLSAVIRGLQIAAQLILKEMSEWFSISTALTLESVVAAVAEPAPPEGWEKFEVSKLLSDSETGLSLKLTLKKNFIQAISEAVFGGDLVQPMTQENRPLSQIEKDVATVFIKKIVRSVSEAFAFPEITNFVFDAPTEEDMFNERPAFKPQVVAKFNAMFGPQSVHFSCELPAGFVLRAIENGSSSAGVKTESNTSWTHKINNLLEPANIELTAILTELHLKISTMSNLRVGQTIPLGITYKSPVKVLSGGVELCDAHLGQINGNYCLHVDQMPNVN